MTCQAYLSKNK